MPIMLDTKDPDEIIRTVLLLQPAFGGVNLEDISQPKCFRILDTLREKAEIPVWHDDQQGTACVTVAGLLNALKIVGKPIDEVQVVFIGSGASNVAITRLCFKAGVDPAKCRVVDSQGILHDERQDIFMRRAEFVDKWRLCQITNAEGRTGGIAEALAGADVCIALSKPGPGTILPEWVATMAEDAIVFACANPVPEIWPWEATGRGRADRGDWPVGFPEPSQQLAGLPRHLPRRAGRAGAHHHRRDVHRGGRGVGRRRARRRHGPRVHPADDGRMGSVRQGGGRGRHEGAGAGHCPAGGDRGRAVPACGRDDPCARAG